MRAVENRNSIVTLPLVITWRGVITRFGRRNWFNEVGNSENFRIW